MSDAMNMFKFIIIIQLFYAFCITILSYSLASTGAFSQDYVTVFSDLSTDINMEGVSTELQDSIQNQLDIPVIELGALIFYSGNIILDLMLNFFYAVPQMLGLLVRGFMLIFNVDNYLFAVVELFASIIVTTLYLIGLLSLLMNIRSGRGTSVV